ncbi:glycoside hydrolase family 99-like domain-containing protein [Vibrio alginolyticus]|uniref:glycoside hydrolase family 99-like domain-containing protein n=1 Tax=Vibrio alginolyticus TaxID=663 RepID=UPI0022DD51DE|nr:glycoside hydrolase family 99-like domain-containing protein [Vibrio alginolyticus]MDA0420470.1 glycoside hydrolase family 99-like domain-containing protein [Vibrio alginolyticus]
MADEQNTQNFEVEINLIELIENSGLFNTEFYHQHNPDVAIEESLLHYFFNGYREARKPSFLFDPAFYLLKNPDVAESDIKPLSHYILFGEEENRQPSIFCDIEHIKKQIQENFEGTALAYFYKNERELLISAHPFFDPKYYFESNPDIRDSELSPFYHFINTGCYEGRNPRADINITDYINQYGVDKETINPFYHFIAFGGEEYLAEQNKHIDHAIDTVTQQGTINYRQKGPHYEEPEYLYQQEIRAKVKAIAYYLPQFHPFKENDEWWGQGFTEWTNVTRGIPRFNGHYQPHLPKHLGYYDLRVKETMLEQVRYAKAAGLHGFCFYHYWFNGKRLMEKPVNLLLENKDIEFPFCIMWANENWTRTWDGFENDVLIAQDYLEEDDVPFIQDIGRHFADSRYIRIDGRPLFFIYRPGIIPNAKATIQKWRDLCEKLLGEKPLFYMAQAFGNNDPREFGMDGAIEFPPHKIAAGLGDSSRAEGLLDPEFQGHYPTYDALVANSLAEPVTKEFPLIRGVTPSWDNEARKPGKGMGYIRSTPEKYEHWLRNIKQQALQNPIAEGEHFVVVNAWNEWAEGAHLEPDVYWGAAYMNATYRALHDIHTPKEKLKLILVGHDAYKHGAQLLTLNIFKTLRNRFGIDAHCILLDGGPLVEEYQNVGPTYVAHGSLEEFNRMVGEINQDSSFAHAICNTTVTGLCTEKLSQHGIKVISLVHELSTLIKEYSLEGHVETISKHAEKVVFAADFVKESFESFTGSLNDQAIVKPQGIYQTLISDQNAYRDLRRKLSLPKDAKIVVNSGYADLRKGFDLFVQIAKQSVAIDAKYHFVWLGNVEPSLKNWILKDIAGSELEKHIHIVPFTNEISLYLEGADVFAMTSREDPFPSVVLEALALGTPVVGFLGGGGFTDALEEDYFGELVPMSDCGAFTLAIENQIKLDTKKSQAKRAAFASEKYDWGDYVFSLVELLIPTLKRVSVAVPNYNYEQHIGDRLKSIFHQHYPIYELIVLDDKSPDSSVDAITSTAKQFNREIKLIVNDTNSGSVFKQWEKGARLAKSEYLWIAEADDLAEPEFISTIMAGDTDFSLAYTDSKQIDENNTHLADNYRYYYDQGMVKLLDKGGIFDGSKVIEEALAIKNQFMNVSSVMFKTQSLVDCFDQYMQDVLKFKVAGDWFIYVQALSQPQARCKVVSESLNTHRRHSGSVTRQNYDVQLEEISNIQHICLIKLQNPKALKTKQDEYIYNVRKVLNNEK